MGAENKNCKLAAFLMPCTRVFRRGRAARNATTAPRSIERSRATIKLSFSFNSFWYEWSIEQCVDSRPDFRQEAAAYLKEFKHFFIEIEWSANWRRKRWKGGRVVLDIYHGPCGALTWKWFQFDWLNIFCDVWTLIDIYSAICCCWKMSNQNRRCFCCC